MAVCSFVTNSPTATGPMPGVMEAEKSPISALLVETATVIPRLPVHRLPGLVRASKWCSACAQLTGRVALLVEQDDSADELVQAVAQGDSPVAHALRSRVRTLGEDANRAPRAHSPGDREVCRHGVPKTCKSSRSVECNCGISLTSVPWCWPSSRTMGVPCARPQMLSRP